MNKTTILAETEQVFGCISYQDNFIVYGDVDTKILVGISEFDKEFEDAVKEHRGIVTFMKIKEWNRPVTFYCDGRDKQGRVQYKQQV